MSQTPTAARATRPKNAPRWRVVGGMGWFAAITALVSGLLALLWRDGLEPASGTLLAAHLVAFMSQTFAWHAGLASAVLALLAAMARRSRLVSVALAAVVANLGPDVHSMFTRPGPRSTSAAVLSVLSMNLLNGEADPKPVLDHVAAADPDVIVFQEWTSRAQAALDGRLRTTHPHVVVQVRDDSFGQAVFSRRPLLHTPIFSPKRLGSSEPQISVCVEHEGRPVRVSNVHLLPPVGLGYFAQQRRVALSLAKWAGGASEDRPDMLIGDFNSTQRSGIHAAMRRAGLREAHATAGSFRGSTWPRNGTLRLAPGVRIDNAFVRPELEVTEAMVGPDVGSDHKPILVRVAWRGAHEP